MKKWIVAVNAIFFLIWFGNAEGLAASFQLDRIDPGPTPFIRFITLRINDPAALDTIKFTVRPKPGSLTRAIAATYTSAYLQSHDYFNLRTGRVTLPVFGLYQNFSNTVTARSRFTDGSSQQKTYTVVTPDFDGGTFDNPTVVQSRLPGSTLSYDFMLLKSIALPGTPVIIDSDAEIRWVGTAPVTTEDSILFQNGLYVADGASLIRQEFDGRYQTLASYESLGVTDFHHNFDVGRDGIIMDADTLDWTECVNIEVDAAGNVLRTWNLADIISAAMTAGGDNPDDFLAPAPADWFHNNATAYRKSDNSLIVSSRENFVIALDYDTQAIKWILGDPTKHWHDFPSLRAFALKLGPDTLPPIGQHAVSIFRDELLLFDDGEGSLYQSPPGETRTYSAPRRYSIVGNTATEVWDYLSDPPIFSPFCSSVYEDAPDNYFIDYSLAGPNVSTDLVGLDATGSIAFYYQYPVLAGCATAWNAIQIHLEDLRFN
jgi:hypothetical protein